MQWREKVFGEDGLERLHFLQILLVAFTEGTLTMVTMETTTIAS